MPKGDKRKPATLGDVVNGFLRESGLDARVEQASVEHSLASLRTFPWVRMKENRKELALHGAWFDISLGELHFYDEAEMEWRALRTG